MNQKLSDWASIAEIAASIAVVITLLLVVSSMRANTNALQANTYQELMRDINSFRASARDSGLSMTEKGIAELFSTAQTDQLQRFGYLTIQLWGIYEAAFFARERGVLGDNEWIRFERMICLEREDGDKYGYWDVERFGLNVPLRDTLTPHFVAYVDDLCQ